ncbi:hypothetical protein [Micromonospora craniellae]|uniref:Uncharacterized protein n=1 Tax=Micromonospora craniellae TaxID=2294034 RepID=A0A372FR46_9ACTN|nr:hypothetical protein [Micromonospora craniellae]QOC90817.1 hypothetical protein ID554_22280 [Micromonospora craniellae]RFS43168.1 hypothetical protein D0Q02_29335 [Micromonospora craniellae]
MVVMLGLAAALVREMSDDPLLAPPTRNRRYGLAAAVRTARSYDDEDPPPVRHYLRRRPR